MVEPGYNFTLQKSEFHMQQQKHINTKVKNSSKMRWPPSQSDLNVMSQQSLESKAGADFMREVGSVLQWKPEKNTTNYFSWQLKHNFHCHIDALDSITVNSVITYLNMKYMKEIMGRTIEWKIGWVLNYAWFAMWTYVVIAVMNSTASKC